jgi:hypothetical protein
MTDVGLHVLQEASQTRAAAARPIKVLLCLCQPVIPWHVRV